MTTLHQLINDVKKEQKISTDELIAMLSNAVTEGKEESDLVKCIYKKAYGDTLSEEMCKRWVGDLYGDNPIWTLSQTTSVGENLGVSWNKISKYEFWAFMNVFYDDFYEHAKRFGHETDPEFYGDIVWSYFCDEDAHDKTPANYYFSFVA